MSELKSCFEAHGFRNVATYIQSGNVLFESSEPADARLSLRLERMLSMAFNYQASVLLRSRRQLQEIVASAPGGFGAQPARYKYDVIFLKRPLTAASAMTAVPARPGVDQAHAGVGVIYYARLISRASQSQFSKLVTLPIYQSMTIRNWNTATKLLRIMEAEQLNRGG